MTDEELKKKISEDADFIRAPKFNNSIATLLRRHPDGIEDKAIARYLMLEEEEIELIYQEAVEKIRKQLGIENE